MSELSLKNFKVRSILDVEAKARAVNAVKRQMIDAGMLASHPGGLKKRNKSN